MFDSFYAQVIYDEHIDVVICRWKTDVTKEQYHTTMLEGIEILKSTKSKTWVVDFF